MSATFWGGNWHDDKAFLKHRECIILNNEYKERLERYKCTRYPKRSRHKTLKGNGYSVLSAISSIAKKKPMEFMGDEE